MEYREGRIWRAPCLWVGVGFGGVHRRRVLVVFVISFLKEAGKVCFPGVG